MFIIYQISFVKDCWSRQLVVWYVLVVNLTFLQIITSSDFDFECYFDFCLVLNVKLNICIKSFITGTLQVLQEAALLTLSSWDKLIIDMQSSALGMQGCHIYYK